MPILHRAPNQGLGKKAVKRRRLREMLAERDGYVCMLCKGQIRDIHPHHITLDHIIPKSMGGPMTVENLQMAHKNCNVSKGNRMNLCLQQ